MIYVEWYTIYEDHVSLTFLPSPDSYWMFIFQSHSKQQFSSAWEVRSTNTLCVVTLDDWQSLLGTGIPNIDLRSGTYLTRGNDSLEFWVLIDSQADDVISVLSVKGLVG